MRFNRVWALLSVTALMVLSAAAQETSVPPASVPAARRAERVAVFTVEGPIDSITTRSLARRLERAKAEGVDAVVIELDTPGGELSAALDLCRLVKHEMPPNTVAWIHSNAYSAGTLIALAAREIVVAPDAVFGTSAPIHAIPGVGMIDMSPAERAKVESPLLSEVIDSARRNHYDERLVQAFVAVGHELWMLEDERTGERVFVDRAEYRAIFGDDPPELLASTAASGSPSLDRRPVRPFLSELFTPKQRRGERSVERSPESIRAQIEFEQTLPAARPRLDASERGRWKLVTQVDTPDRLLTVRTDEALAFGLAAEVVTSDADLARFFGAREVRRYGENWSEGLVRFLMSWPVRLVLVGVMVICFLVELAVPGFGAFGAAALVCLAILIGAPALVGLAQWWQLALVVIGLLLIVTELVFVPGTLFVGLAGAIFVLIGVAGAFVQSELNTAAGQRELLFAIGGTLGAAIIAAFAGGAILRRLGGPALLRLAVLDTEIGGAGVELPAAPESDAGRAEGHVTTASGASAAVMGRHRTPLLPAGTRGVAYTDLRPAGKGDFGGTIYDVRCVEGYLEQGRPIRVVRSGSAELDVESDET